ncbi:hypothetical protein F5Y11DRAFT_164018 [Daldinia sp. FL1419]|nr:hypothetical protein F5Y11DRAFT_164018 [Daldinia sp. FL1419]
MVFKFFTLVRFIAQMLPFTLKLLIFHPIFAIIVLKRKWFLGPISRAAPEFHTEHRTVLVGLELITVWACYVFIKYLGISIFVCIAVNCAVQNEMLVNFVQLLVFVVGVTTFGYWVSTVLGGIEAEALLLDECDKVARKYRWDRYRLCHFGPGWPQNAFGQKVLETADKVHNLHWGDVEHIMFREFQDPERYNPNPEWWSQQDLEFLATTARMVRQGRPAPFGGL